MDFEQNCAAVTTARMFPPYQRPVYMGCPCAQPPGLPPDQLPPPGPTHAAMVTQGSVPPPQGSYAPVPYTGYAPPFPQPYCDASSPYWQMMPVAPEYFNSQAAGSMDLVSSNPFFRALMQQQEAADHALKTRRVERVRLPMASL